MYKRQRHYQWYPFMNMGHYHLAKVDNSRISKEFIRNMRTGIERTYEKAVEKMCIRDRSNPTLVYINSVAAIYSGMGLQGTCFEFRTYPYSLSLIHI